eukprot:6491099-Amphidinium_carterae.1
MAGILPPEDCQHPRSALSFHWETLTVQLACKSGHCGQERIWCAHPPDGPLVGMSFKTKITCQP